MNVDEDELLEVVDSDGGFIRLAPRRQCHSDPSLIHRSVCVLVYDPYGHLFIQKRSRHKDLYASMRDLSATGHARPGEADQEAALRELREELGIEARLEFIGRVLVRQPLETELVTVFRCVHAGPMHLDPIELEGGEFMGPGKVGTLPDLTPYALGILSYMIEGQRA